MYAESCKDIVLSSLNGINGTVFMYGQTGAGKKFTMLGQSDIKEKVNLQKIQSHARQNKTLTQFYHDQNQSKPQLSVSKQGSESKRSKLVGSKRGSICKEDTLLKSYSSKLSIQNSGSTKLKVPPLPIGQINSMNRTQTLSTRLVKKSSTQNLTERRAPKKQKESVECPHVSREMSPNNQLDN